MSAQIDLGSEPAITFEFVNYPPGIDPWASPSEHSHDDIGAQREDAIEWFKNNGCDADSISSIQSPSGATIAFRSPRIRNQKYLDELHRLDSEMQSVTLQRIKALPSYIQKRESIRIARETFHEFSPRRRMLSRKAYLFEG